MPGPAWVAAVAASIRRHWQAHGRSEKLMFSFHGLPQRVANNGDPYPQRCQVSASLIAAALNLNESEWVLGYQSRFGAERWLQPYAEPTLWALAESGIRRFDLVCPGFPLIAWKHWRKWRSVFQKRWQRVVQRCATFPVSMMTLHMCRRWLDWRNVRCRE